MQLKQSTPESTGGDVRSLALAHLVGRSKDYGLAGETMRQCVALRRTYDIATRIGIIGFEQRGKYLGSLCLALLEAGPRGFEEICSKVAQYAKGHEIARLPEYIVFSYCKALYEIGEQSFARSLLDLSISKRIASDVEEVSFQDSALYLLRARFCMREGDLHGAMAHLEPCATSPRATNSLAVIYHLIELNDKFNQLGQLQSGYKALEFALRASRFLEPKDLKLRGTLLNDALYQAISLEDVDIVKRHLLDFDEFRGRMTKRGEPFYLSEVEFSGRAIISEIDRGLGGDPSYGPILKLRDMNKPLGEFYEGAIEVLVSIFNADTASPQHPISINAYRVFKAVGRELSNTLRHTEIL